MIATTNLPKPDEIKHQIPKPDLPQQKPDGKLDNTPVIDLDSWQGTKTVPNQVPKTTPKRANESMKQFLKNHKKKSTSPKNRTAGPSKSRSNEGQPKTKVQRLKNVELKATSDADSWDSDFYQNCKNASQDKNQVNTKSRDNNVEDQNLEKDSSSSSLIKDTSGNLFGNSDDDFDSENDENFLELTRTKIEPSEVPETVVKKPNDQKNAVIVIDSGRFSKKKSILLTNASYADKLIIILKD